MTTHMVRRRLVCCSHRDNGPLQHDVEQCPEGLLEVASRIEALTIARYTQANSSSWRRAWRSGLYRMPRTNSTRLSTPHWLVSPSGWLEEDNRRWSVWRWRNMSACVVWSRPTTPRWAICFLKFPVGRRIRTSSIPGASIVPFMFLMDTDVLAAPRMTYPQWVFHSLC